MTHFILHESIEKFIHQNHGTIEDCEEGCLIDNYLISAKRGIIAVYERYANANSSVHECYFVPYKDAIECNKLEDDFYDFFLDEEE